MSSPDDFEDQVREHDARVAEAGLALWVGSEPTFTDRFSGAPEWTGAALGGDKEQRAQALLRALHRHWPAAVVLRSEGRRYAGEDAPRWSYGLLQRRDGQPAWPQLRDPLLDGHEAPLVTEVLPDFGADASAARAAIDALAQRHGADAQVAIGGAVPPVDATLAHTTLTPDPAVIEVNAAPSLNALDFLQRTRTLYMAAAEQGLAPYRLHFNGVVADSGGGGQITLGGPTPQESPFVRDPRLLPRLVRFMNRHPSLSYLFCHDFVGPGGQSVRSDERGPGAFDELQLALALVAGEPQPTAQRVWQCLAPFLADATGNNHRAELNVEKLCNPDGGVRGMLGLVEFRALRMQHTAERATALACLLRAVVAMLARQREDVPLVDWARTLHDRFALPWYLQQDLQAVLAQLADHGFGLGPAIAAQLLADEFRHQATVDLPGARLEVWRALEFWPLLGDAASPEQGGSTRLIDASTARVELRLRPHDATGAGWQIQAGRRLLPQVDERDAQGALRVGGLRYRAFAPMRGLHPTLPPQTPVTLHLHHPALREARVVTLHEWRPDGGAYPGLPVDLADAAARRAERVTLDTEDPAVLAPVIGLSGGRTLHTLDLRWPVADESESP